jgi:6-phosphofructokinase 1
MRIAISTGGGDAPGLNAVIRSAALCALNRGWTALGIRRGFGGLLGDARVVHQPRQSVPMAYAADRRDMGRDRPLG